MEEWKEYKLGDIAKIKGGKRLPKGKNLITIPNSHPYIRISDINNKKILNLDSSFEYVDDETQLSISKYIVKKGDLIISIVGTIGLVTIIGETLDNANLTENCAKIIDISDLDKNYLYYYLTSVFGVNEIKKNIVGAVQPKLPIKNIQNIKILAPNIGAQIKIASILSSLDDKIENNKRINENLEQQAQALFKSWFVDFEPFRDQPFVESELGMIPQGWKVGKLEDLCKIKYGKGLSKNKLLDEGFPVFGGNGIIGYYSDYLYELPQILVSCRGAASGKIIESLPKSFVTSNSLILELLDRDYYYYLKNNLLISPLYEYATGSAQPQITIDNIKGVKIIVPTKDVINGINCTFKILDEMKYNCDIADYNLSKLRDTLLPKLMSGEIKV